MTRSEQAQEQYAKLASYASRRASELTQMLTPYIEVTDAYGVLFCDVVNILGRTPPKDDIDAIVRDLLADVFDFLYEARPLIIKGKLEIAFPLARRAFESLSLMVACHLDHRVGHRWKNGEQISNKEIRQVLGKHPKGESEPSLRSQYKFFSQTTHPNRDTIPQRFLGEGNEFVLGSIGAPSLCMLADYALKTLELWFWFGAFVSAAYLAELDRGDREYSHRYMEAAKKCQAVYPWLVDQYNRTLAEETAAPRRQQSNIPSADGN
jgi:hypothetical protein